MTLVNAVAIVSGGARGIGAAEARALVQSGACVVIGDVLDEEEHRLVRDLNPGENNHRACYMHLNVTEMSDGQRAVTTAQERFARLTILVNNAGVSGRLGLEETSEEEWHRVLDTDLTSAWLGMKACIPSIRAAGGGAIVNTSSVYGLVASAAATAYHAAKGGVLMLTRGSRGAVRR